MTVAVMKAERLLRNSRDCCHGSPGVARIPVNRGYSCFPTPLRGGVKAAALSAGKEMSEMERPEMIPLSQQQRTSSVQVSASPLNLQM